jgi:F-type H+-transporting ATPase subunit delta
MAATSPNTPIVMRYARALLQLANERQESEQIRTELESVREILDANKTFEAMLSDPAVGVTTRSQLVERAFGGGRASPTMANFLGLLNSKGRIGLLREIVAAYSDLMEQQLGNVEVDVTVAQQLSADQLEQVRLRVSKALGRNAVVQQRVDDAIIGGLVLRVEDKLIDASVRHQLETLRRQLLQAGPK